MEEARPPTKKLCSCGADLASLSVYHVRKHLAGSNHLPGTSSEWAADAHVHQEDACGAAPVRRAEVDVARGPIEGDRRRF